MTKTYWCFKHGIEFKPGKVCPACIGDRAFRFYMMFLILTVFTIIWWFYK